MGSVIASMSMSLDGFIAAPHDTRAEPLGAGGARLHRWLRELHDADDRQVMDELVRDIGAVVMGRRSYDLCVGEGGWGDQGPLGTVPCFVLTHHPPRDCPAPTVFTFVTDGIHGAVDRAKAAADGRDIGLHGAGAVQQSLRHKLVDLIQIHLVPVLLGAGIRLFDDIGTVGIELQRDRVLGTDETTHLRFRVTR